MYKAVRVPTVFSIQCLCTFKSLVSIVASTTKLTKLTGVNVTLYSPIEARYAGELAELANDIEVKDNIGAHSFPHPYTLEHALDFIDRNREMESVPFAMDFLILYRNRPAGIIGLSDINYLDRKAHIGYWVGKRYRGKGIATEATGLVCDYAFGTLKLRRLHTKVLEGNLASMRVLVNNGFEIEGIERDAFYSNDKYTSFILFSRIERYPAPTQ